MVLVKSMITCNGRAVWCISPGLNLYTIEIVMTWRIPTGRAVWCISPGLNPYTIEIVMTWRIPTGENNPGTILAER